MANKTQTAVDANNVTLTLASANAAYTPLALSSMFAFFNDRHIAADGSDYDAKRHTAIMQGRCLRVEMPATLHVLDVPKANGNAGECNIEIAHFDAGRRYSMQAALPCLKLLRETGNAYLAKYDAVKYLTKGDLWPLGVPLAYAAFKALASAKAPMAVDDLVAVAVKSSKCDVAKFKHFKGAVVDAMRDCYSFGIVASSMSGKRIDGATLFALSDAAREAIAAAPAK